MNIRRHKQVHRVLWLWWGGVLIGTVLLWLTTPCPADNPRGESTTVFYQVTYQDKTVENLPEPPTTNEGILMVTRITRTNSSLGGTKTVSTGNQSIEMFNPGRTQETQLRWDGSAWRPAVRLSDHPPSPSRRKTGRPADDGTEPKESSAPRPAARPLSPDEIAAQMQKIMELIGISDRALRRAEQSLAAADSPQAIRAAEKALEEARQAQQSVLTELVLLKAALRDQPPARRYSSLAPTTPPVSAGNDSAYDPNRPITPPPTLDTSIGVSGWGGWPDEPWGWPGGNVMIQTQQPNPDFDTGPRVIVREQE